MVNLFSDTQTQPTDAMREAMARAAVGDEQLGLDPTVNVLQERVAELLGFERALFLPTGTMCNVIAFRLHLRPGGDQVLLGRDAHPLRFEAGGPAALSGAVLTVIGDERGMFRGDDVRAAAFPPGDRYAPRTRLVSVEQPTNVTGGLVWSPEDVRSVVDAARELGLRAHMDGARLMNAVAASGTAAAEWADGFDTVWIDFTKALGAPVGACLAGSAELIEEAWRYKQMLGGAMRQAGIVAAGALHALDHHVERLAEDHENARALAAGLAELDGVTLDPSTVETNIVVFGVARAKEFCAAMWEAGVMLVPLGDTHARAVTHLDVDREGVDRAIAIAGEVLAGRVDGRRARNSVPGMPAYRTCPFCEATCGLEMEVRDGTVDRVRGDADDVFSRGFLCPKGVSLKELHEDPDRVRTPLRRTASGDFEECSWEDAFALIHERLPALVEAHGRDAVGVYIGNPAAHGLSALLYGRVLLKALGSKSIFSASTVDQFPKQAASALMFGTGLSVPVPDLDRTDFLLVLGANPMASNGSLMTAPDVRGRLRAIRARGGRVVVVDPRRTRTAAEADTHLFIRPGTDALLLFALAHVIFEEGLAELGAAEGLVRGLDEVRELAAGFAPEDVAVATGIEADAIRSLARDLAGASSAAVYGRIGTTAQAFGTVASWLVDVLNAITGNLDKPGGAMFTLPAAGSANTRGEPRIGRGFALGRWQSRVRGLGEVFGELPAAALAEEIDTPGDGRIRALITLAGNPVVSTPNAGRLDAALEDIDFMVSLDIYVNETTRHADLILPAPSPLEKGHYDLALYSFAVRNVANWSPPVLDRGPGVRDEWETLLALTGILTGQGPDADIATIDEFVARGAVQLQAGDSASVVAGRDVDELMQALEPRVGPARLLDLALRCGPYGEGFGARPDGLSLAALEAAPHGVDLGPLEPRLPEVLRTPDGLIDLAPAPIVADVERLHSMLDEWTGANGERPLVLIGRRHLRSNNSWMHNLPVLMKGPERCTALVNPVDAARLELADGDIARVSSRVGEIEIPVEISDEMMEGVVSIPHGWGGGAAGDSLRVSAERPGANTNVLADETLLEPLTGTAVLNGIPVTLAPVAAAVS